MKIFHGLTQLQGTKSFGSTAHLSSICRRSRTDFHFRVPPALWVVGVYSSSCFPRSFPCLLRGLRGASVLFASTTSRSHAEGGGISADTDSCKLMALISLDERGSYYKPAHAGCMSVGGWFTPKGEGGCRPSWGLVLQELHLETSKITSASQQLPPAALRKLLS